MPTTTASALRFHEVEAMLAGRRIVVIGSAADLTPELRMLAEADWIYLPFGRVEMAPALGADVILTPLFGTGADALDVAQRLARLRFPGALRAFSSGIAKPAMIRDEVRRAVRRLDFDVIDLPPPPPGCARTPEKPPKGFLQDRG